MAVMFGAMLMRLVPLLEHSLWGSDWGEYYHLTDGLVSDGAHVERNLGWGRAYVDFPGLFDLSGAVALVTGIGVANSMTLVIPCVTAVSSLLVATIVLRLRGGPWAALLAAIAMAIVFPEVYTNSHPVPGPVGSVMLIGTLLVFMLGDTWRRDEGVDAERPMVLFALLLLMVFALTVTHHMSHFFLLLVLGMAYLVRNALVSGPEPERDLWGLWSLVACLAMATVHWVLIADTFRDEVMGDLAGLPGYVMMGLAWAALPPLWAIGAWLRGRRTGVPDLPFWGVKELSPFLVAYLVVGVALVTLVALFGFPGTDLEPGRELVIYVMPTTLVFVFIVGSSDVVLRRHGGHIVLAWAAAITGSYLVTSVLENQVLVPYRHVPYIMESLAVLMGIGCVHLVRMYRPDGRSSGSGGPGRVPGVLVLVLLVVGLAMTAYPPKTVMAGFQEGTAESELGATLWLRGGLPGGGAVPSDQTSGALVSDHRLSSMAFGIGGQMATWDKGGAVLHGKGDGDLLRALDDVDTPNGDRPVTAVLISEDLRTGAALSQVESARPVDGEAWDKFSMPPFYTVYDGGDVWVMVVWRPLDTTGEP